MTGKNPTTTPCSVGGCDRMVYAKQLCRPHWARWQRNGDLELSPNGEEWTKEEDHIILSIPAYPSGRAKFKAIEIVAAKLGRTADAANTRRCRLRARQRLKNQVLCKVVI